MSNELENDKNLPAIQTVVDPPAIQSPDDVDPFEKLAREEGRAAVLKFEKGIWASKEEARLNERRMVAQIRELMVGWRKWQDSKIVDADAGYVADNFKPKRREELDDQEETDWPIDATGKRSDPWSFGFYLQLIDDDGVLYTWTASSKGARGAIANLSRDFVNHRRKGGRGDPIVVLNTSFYKHRTYGRVDTPLLRRVGWTDFCGGGGENRHVEPQQDEAALAAPPTANVDDGGLPYVVDAAIDDDIQF